MKRWGAFVLWIALLAVAACKDDDYVYPDVLTEFADAHTNGEGTLTQLVNDRGEQFDIQARSGLGGLTRDSVYRTLCVYAPLDASASAQPKEVKLYSIQLVVSSEPIEERRLVNGMKTDPLDIQSIWRAGNYVNMVLLPLVKDQAHAYYFIENGIDTHSNGKRTLRLTLYHNRHGDYEAFTHKTYFSIPLQGYRNRLAEGDTIRLRINTYKEGMTTRTFIY